MGRGLACSQQVCCSCWLDDVVKFIFCVYIIFFLPCPLPPSKQEVAQAKKLSFLCVLPLGALPVHEREKKFGSTRFDLLNGARYFIRCGTRYDVVFYVDSVFFILFQWRVHKFRAQNGNLNCWFSSGSATIFAAAPHRQGGRQRLHVLVRVQLIYLHEMCQIYAHINRRSVFVRWKSQLFERIEWFQLFAKSYRERGNLWQFL